MILEKSWEEVTMDFIIDFPKTKDGYIAIIVFVDWLTKMAHFVPLKVLTDTPAMAKAFLDNMFHLHGLLCIIISDWDIYFMSCFWQILLTLLGMILSFSTVYYPQSDSQTEYINYIIEEILLNYVNYRMNNWDSWLTLAEFTYNNSIYMSSTISLFEANYSA